MWKVNSSQWQTISLMMQNKSQSAEEMWSSSSNNIYNIFQYMSQLHPGNTDHNGAATCCLDQEWHFSIKTKTWLQMCHFVILLKSEWLKKQSPERQMNSKNVEKHAKQVELQKSIKTIRRELLEPFFVFFCCNAVVIHKVHTSINRQHRPSFLHSFIHSFI